MRAVERIELHAIEYRDRKYGSIRAWVGRCDALSLPIPGEATVNPEQEPLALKPVLERIAAWTSNR
jgi:hypothetical protein